LGKIEEILIVIVIILLLFGSKKIPELARNLGKSVREVKKGFNGEETEDPKDSNSKSGK
jgi:sec-independent protein translocase protein TatA